MKEYVLGFAFSSNGEHIVLIRKERPDWQKGRLNGVGGKVEEHEETYDAMVREFKEETGVSIKDWKHFADMVFTTDIMGGSAVIHCYKIFDNKIYDCRTSTEEEIAVWPVSTAIQNSNKKLLPNLRVLIPIALSGEFEFVMLQGI